MIPARLSTATEARARSIAFVVAALAFVLLIVPLRALADAAWVPLIDVVVSICAVCTVVLSVAIRQPAPSRPWVLLATAAVCRLLADLLWYAHGWLREAPPPEVWFDDVGYVVSYLSIIAAMSAFAARSSGDCRLGVIDTAVVGCGLATVMWVALAEPIAAAHGWPATTEGSAVAAPLLDLLVTTMVLRWMVNGGIRGAQPLLMGAAFVALLFADHTHLVNRIAYGGAAAGSPAVNVGWLCWYVLLAAAALAPTRVTAPQTLRSDGRPRAHVVVFGSAALLGPIATLVAVRLGTTEEVRWWGLLVVPVAITAVLTLLLILRVTLLARDARQRAGELATALAEQHRLNRELDRASRHDPRSGLPNLTGFSHAAAQADATPGGEVILIELDRFDDITNAVGHHAGRHLLRQVAEALTEAAPNGTLLAQLDGAQFAAYTSAIGNTDTPAILLQAIRGPFMVAGIPITVEAHAGVATGIHLESTLQRADTARHAARRLGDRSARWHPGLDRTRAADLQIVTELHDAVGRDELILHYQPIVGREDGRVHGLEALVRWQHPHQGLLSPAAFIAQAERSDVIEVVTDWVIVAAIGQLGRWHHAGWPVAVSVNVSAATLGRDDLVGRIAETLSTQRVPAQQLTIEITETAIMSNPTTAQRCLRDLRDLGCRISIDDFGTGNTSLALLTQLPVDELKIDRMFISSLTHSTVHRAIAQGVAAMAHQMNLTTVAEGIEDAVTAQSVAALDIDLMQGYHFARPQPPEFWNSHFIPQRPHATGSEFVIATS